MTKVPMTPRIKKEFLSDLPDPRYLRYLRYLRLAFVTADETVATLCNLGSSPKEGAGFV
jgi:hypothetical protein